MNKIISIILSAMLLIGMFNISPTNADAATNNTFMVQIQKTGIINGHDTVTITIPRKTADNKFIYTNMLDSKVNNMKNGFGKRIVWIKNTTTGTENRFLIYPYNPGTVNFAIAMYHYNGNTKDCVFVGLIEYQVSVQVNKNGIPFITNLTSINKGNNGFLKAYMFNGSKSTQRYRQDLFYSLSRTNIKTKDTNTFEESFSIQKQVSNNTINNVQKQYNFSSYYHPSNVYHVHSYVNGRCSICGDSYSEYQTIPEVFIANECPEKGTIQEVADQKGSYGGNVPFLLYIPNGWDKNIKTKYDVVVFIHGSGGHRNFWIKNNYTYVYGKNTYNIAPAQLFDWLIYTGKAAPFIAVSLDLPSLNKDGRPSIWDGLGNSYSSDCYDLFASNVLKPVLPYIISHYRTYATSMNNIKTNSNHFILCGNSQGAIAASYIGANSKGALNQYFGQIFILSNFDSAERMINYHSGSSNKLYFANGGSKEDYAGNTLKPESNRVYTIMSRYKGRVPYESFIEYTYGHRYETWFSAFCAFMQRTSK